MTWKRVATAVVLIPVVVALVLFAPTSVIALVLALITLLALFEYFALGEAIGHRAYRFWTASCALILIFVQWFARVEPQYGLPRRMTFPREMHFYWRISPTVPDVFFSFVIGIALLTLWTKRPL